MRFARWEISAFCTLHFAPQSGVVLTEVQVLDLMTDRWIGMRDETRAEKCLCSLVGSKGETFST
jgi:hypothetical protein